MSFIYLRPVHVNITKQNETRQKKNLRQRGHSQQKENAVIWLLSGLSTDYHVFFRDLSCPIMAIYDHLGRLQFFISIVFVLRFNGRNGKWTIAIRDESWPYSTAIH